MSGNLAPTPSLRPKQRLRFAASTAANKLYQTTGQVRPWEVVHACDFARDVADVVEAQLSVGMRPYLLTSKAAGPSKEPHSASLMRTWHDVRQWRKQLDENREYLRPQLIHAHSFAPGMAAVRSGDAVVYDVASFIHEHGSGSGKANSNSWLARSFRSAEQFVLTRSCAIVVHSKTMRTECLERGVAVEDIFVVPNPVCCVQARANERGLSEVPGEVTVFVNACQLEKNPAKQPDALSLDLLLAAFAQACREVKMVRLCIASSVQHSDRICGKARALGLTDYVSCVDYSNEAMSSADIVIVDSLCLDGNLGLASGDFVLTAMAQSQALLAADNEANRELSPHGRGLLWYSADPKNRVRDLAHRLTFLARNPDFCRALGDAGQRHISETRGPQRIGRLYDEVYRHAYMRANRGNSSTTFSGSMIPVHSCM